MKLGAITLQNSVCLATAPWDLAGAGYEQLGAIFTKTVTMEPRAGLPGDDGILQVADQTLLNRTDMRIEGAELLVQEHLPRLRRFGVPVFVSITAPGVPGFRKIARYLQREVGEQLAGLEVYITVPPGGSGADVTARFVREATVIGAYTFIGPHSVVAPGSRIGRGVLVRAFSYVSGVVPDFAIVGGQPAQVIGDTRQLDQAWLTAHPQQRADYDAWAHRET